MFRNVFKRHLLNVVVAKFEAKIYIYICVQNATLLLGFLCYLKMNKLLYVSFDYLDKHVFLLL